MTSQVPLADMAPKWIFYQPIWHSPRLSVPWSGCYESTHVCWLGASIWIQAWTCRTLEDTSRIAGWSPISRFCFVFEPPWPAIWCLGGRTAAPETVVQPILSPLCVHHTSAARPPHAATVRRTSSQKTFQATSAGVLSEHRDLLHGNLLMGVSPISLSCFWDELERPT